VASHRIVRLLYREGDQNLHDVTPVPIPGITSPVVLGLRDTLTTPGHVGWDDVMLEAIPFP
jgi:hypothetical protein